MRKHFVCLTRGASFFGPEHSSVKGKKLAGSVNNYSAQPQISDSITESSGAHINGVQARKSTQPSTKQETNSSNGSPHTNDLGDRRPAHAWSLEREELLTRLWTEGLSASQIGARLGMTRNAIIGKANRLGLKRREGRVTNVAQKRRWHATRKDKIVRVPTPKFPKGEKTAIQLDRSDPAYTDCLSIEQLTEQSCRWPIGEPSRFCGRQRGEGRYCREHHARSIVSKGNRSGNPHPKRPISLRISPCI